MFSKNIKKESKSNSKLFDISSEHSTKRSHSEKSGFYFLQKFIYEKSY